MRACGGARAGCAARPGKGTLAELRNVRPDVQEAKVEQGLDQAMLGYRRFLEETPETQMTPEAMRRLADLQIEKQFGIRTGAASRGRWPLRRPRAGRLPASPAADAGHAGTAESEQDFERGRPRRAECRRAPADVDPTATLEAIALYDQLLTEYPSYEGSDKVLYQKARAYDELGRTEEPSRPWSA
jgi:hypothetical protein